jgi:integrase
MANSSYGSGSLYQRGDIWWVRVSVGNKQHRESSKSTKKADAIKLRDKLLGKKHRRELSGGPIESVLISELLDDVLKSDIEASTHYVWGLVVEKHLRPFFGKIRAARLSTDLLDDYREKRIEAGRTHSTANRELSILRTAFHNGRKRTPPKVRTVPYFPMVKETTIRTGFLSDDVYTKLRDALEDDLKTLFVCGYVTGIRKGELLQVEWSMIDFESVPQVIRLPAEITKTGEGRRVPILEGNMRDFLKASKRERDEQWPDSPWVFSRRGIRIKDFRGGWDNACKAAGVPDLNFHDLRRTAVRNMSRDGVPQVIRMKISGHKTDSMERRYNIADDEDMAVAKEFMERGMQERSKPQVLKI